MSENQTMEQVINDVQEGKAKVISIKDGIENQEVVGEVETITYNDTTEQEHTGFTSLDKALQYDLFVRLKELRDAKDELGEFYVIDRFNSSDFVEAFKDGMNSYRADAVLCERLYKKDMCKESTRHMYIMSEEAQALAKEFAEYAGSVNLDAISEEELEVMKNKVADYQERLKSEDMQPKLTEVPVLVYDNGISELLVTSLSDVDDDKLENYCMIISKFVIVYFLTMRIMFDNNFKLHVTPIKSGDYIDLISIINPE